MISKRVMNLTKQLACDYDLICVELDTSQQRLMYISDENLRVDYKDAFKKFWDNIKQNEAVVVSIDEHSDMYEVSNDCVVLVLYENNNDKYLLYDCQDAKKIEGIMLSCLND